MNGWWQRQRLRPAVAPGGRERYGYRYGRRQGAAGARSQGWHGGMAATVPAGNRFGAADVTSVSRAGAGSREFGVGSTWVHLGEPVEPGAGARQPAGRSRAIADRADERQLGRCREKRRCTPGSVWGQRKPGSSERKIGTRRKGRDRAPVGVKELQLYRSPTSKGKWET